MNAPAAALGSLERPHVGAPVASKYVRIDYNEIASLSGREFSGDWFVIEPSRREHFVEATYLYETYGPFTSSYVEGYYLLGLFDALVNAVIRDEGRFRDNLSYGFDRLRFTATAALDSVLRLRVTIGDVRERNSGSLVTFHCILERSDGVPVVVADWLVLLPGVTGTGELAADATGGEAA